MQNWQKDRNYRKYANEDGSFTYIITVDGEDVEVNEEIYKVYSQADRRERYCAEQEAGRLLSFDGMVEADDLLSYLADCYVESAEDAIIRAEDEEAREVLAEKAATAFSALKDDERDLIQALVIDGVTEREYALKIGLSQKGVNKRKKRILEYLKKTVLKP